MFLGCYTETVYHVLLSTLTLFLVSAILVPGDDSEKLKVKKGNVLCILMLQLQIYHKQKENLLLLDKENINLLVNRKKKYCCLFVLNICRQQVFFFLFVFLQKGSEGSRGEINIYSSKSDSH